MDIPRFLMAAPPKIERRWLFLLVRTVPARKWRAVTCLLGGTVIELGSAILPDPPLPLPEQVPESLSEAFRHCVRKQMVQRYQHVGETQAALQAIETHNEDRPPRRHAGMGAQALTIRSVACAAIADLPA